MKNREQNETKIGGLMALVLFGLFAVCILLVLLTGADVYRKLTVRDRLTYEKRTAVQYLTTKIRQADVAGWIESGTIGDLDALVISEEVEGEVYCTWIYCYDGYLRELFAAADSDMGPEAGEKILEAADLTAEYESGQVIVELTATDGTVQRIVLSRRSGKEVPR